MLPEVVDHVSLYLHRAQTPEKKTIKERYNGQVSNTIETSRLNSTTCPHSFTPPASMAQITQRCGGNYTKEIGISRQHSAARYSNGGKPEDAPQQYSDVTTIPQTRHFRFWRRHIFQDGGAVDLGKRGGGGFFHLFLLLFFYVCTCASVLSNMVHT